MSGRPGRSGGARPGSGPKRSKLVLRVGDVVSLQLPGPYGLSWSTGTIWAIESDSLGLRARVNVPGSSGDLVISWPRPEPASE